MKKLGIHHVSSLVADIQVSYGFYHKILGMKLLMKTVNQDDTTMYHLFFSDMEGRPGTEFTVFQLNTFKKNKFGTNAIDRTVFSVKSLEALKFWEQRLTEYNVEHCGIETYGETSIIRFEDPDGMQLGFSIQQEEKESFLPNIYSEIPLELAIQGIHSVHLRVIYPKATAIILNDYFGFQTISQIPHEKFPVTVMKNTQTDFQHEIHLIQDKINPLEDQGVGGIHHVALYVETLEDLEKIQTIIDEKSLLNSGIMPREFFDATYFRDPNGILFEVATKTHGVPMAIETEKIEDVPLYLPEFLEENRGRIESELTKIEEGKMGN